MLLALDALSMTMQVAFSLTFFVCRLLIGPCVMRTCLQTPSTSIIVKVKRHHMRDTMCSVCGRSTLAAMCAFHLAFAWRRLGQPAYKL